MFRFFSDIFTSQRKLSFRIDAFSELGERHFRILKCYEHGEELIVVTKVSIQNVPRSDVVAEGDALFAFAEAVINTSCRIIKHYIIGISVEELEILKLGYHADPEIWRKPEWIYNIQDPSDWIVICDEQEIPHITAAQCVYNGPYSLEDEQKDELDMRELWAKKDFSAHLDLLRKRTKNIWGDKSYHTEYHGKQVQSSNRCIVS